MHPPHDANIFFKFSKSVIHSQSPAADPNVKNPTIWPQNRLGSFYMAKDSGSRGNRGLKVVAHHNMGPKIAARKVLSHLRKSHRDFFHLFMKVPRLDHV